VFSCISRKLNNNNAFSLPVMMRLCDEAYKTKSVVEHIVLTNNMNWNDFIGSLAIPKTQLVAGINEVRNLCFVLVVVCTPLNRHLICSLRSRHADTFAARSKKYC
jgi:hypothetical protein